MSNIAGIKTNIHDEPIKGHRYGKKLTNNDFGTVAFLINRGDILKNKKENANSFIDPELRYNCIYFLIGHEYDDNGNTIEKMYVGQAGIRDNKQSVLDRLNEHAWLKNDPAKYIDKWTDIVVVTNEKRAWGATELNALEHIFWSLIPVGNRLNSQQPTCTGADLESFTDTVSQIKQYLDYLEFTTFKEKTTQNIINDVKEVADSKSDIPIDLDHGTSRIPNITTPLKVINQMLDLLPEEIWNDQTVFLDPACKDGGYLKAIHDRLVKRPELIQKYHSERALSIHILSEQLYGIALNQNSRAVTIDKLDGFRYNIRVIPNYIISLKYLSDIIRKENKIDATTLIQKVIDKEFNKEMKIDVVIGNPPYNNDDGGGGINNSALPIYSDFATVFSKCSRISAFIIPSRWLAGGKTTLDSFRKYMVESKHIKSIYYYANMKEVFPNIKLSGGVLYYLYDSDKDYDVTDFYYCGHQKTGMTKKILDEYRYRDTYNNEQYMIITDIYADNIIRKVKSIDNIGISIQYDPFNLLANFEDCDHPFNDSVKVVCSNSRETYTSRENISRSQHLIDEYKVITGKVNPDGGGTNNVSEGWNVINVPRILNPGEVCTITYFVIGHTKSMEIASNLITLLKSKFFRYMIMITISGMNLSQRNYTFVPRIRDFSHPWNDDLLYKRYGLSNNEIEHIEKTIKSMDDTPSKPKVKLTNGDMQANYINKMLNNQ